MFPEFEELKQDYFHHVSCGPSEKKLNLPNVPYSDICLHLVVLEWYASKCSYIVEFGVRDAFSTVAFLSGLPTGGSLVSVDIQETNVVRNLRKMETGKNWKFILSDSLDPKLDIGSPDMIFFDTLHTYEQLDKELKLHMLKATKYLAFHDTFTCWDKDKTGPDPSAEGIGRAIKENLTDKAIERRQFGNGITSFAECDVTQHFKLDFETKWSNGLQIYKTWRHSLL